MRSGVVRVVEGADGAFLHCDRCGRDFDRCHAVNDSVFDLDEPNYLPDGNPRPLIEVLAGFFDDEDDDGG